MPKATFPASSLLYGQSSATWPGRLPTILGLTIVLGLAIHNLVSALVEPADWTVSLGVRMHGLGGGGYWVDPQSLGRVMRVIVFSAGINWILAIALVLIVLFGEKRLLTSIGLRNAEGRRRSASVRCIGRLLLDWTGWEQPRLSL